MKEANSDEMRVEYDRKDLGEGVRGKHFEKYQASAMRGEIMVFRTGSGAVERIGKIEDLDRSFDIAYWQRQGPEAIFAAAQELVVDAHRIKGIPLDDTIRRDVERFGRIPG
jgi:hypothetical protein